MDNPLREYFLANQGRQIHKWTHFFDIYHRHFAPYRDREITFLEIGVQHGGSLQMWKAYFGKKARIIGIDIDQRCKQFEEENVQIHIMSQDDRHGLKQLCDQVGGFDIILDDGGHMQHQQIISFQILYPFVKQGGLYCVEDLHCSYWKEFGGGYRKKSTFIEFSKDMVDSLNAWHSRDPNSFNVDAITQTTYGLHFYDSILVMEKRAITKPTVEMSGKPSF